MKVNNTVIKQWLGDDGLDLEIEVRVERKLSAAEYEKMGNIINRVMDDLKDALNQTQ